MASDPDTEGMDPQASQTAPLDGEVDTPGAMGDGQDMGLGLEEGSSPDALGARGEQPTKAEQPTPRASGFMGVPLEVLICVGRARPLVSDVVRLRRDSVLELDTLIDDPVELFIGDRLIAKGELQEMDDGQGRLGVRLTEVADLSHGV